MGVGHAPHRGSKERTSKAAIAVVGCLLALVALAMLLLWPQGSAPLTKDTSARQVNGFVEEVSRQTCPVRPGQKPGSMAVRGSAQSVARLGCY